MAVHDVVTNPFLLNSAARIFYWHAEIAIRIIGNTHGAWTRAFCRAITWFMRSSSITCKFISALTVTNRNCISATIGTFWGRKDIVIQGLQVQLHRLSGVTLEVVPVIFPDKCKLALTVLLPNWKPCSSRHHVSETELSCLRVCRYWLCTELIQAELIQAD